MSQQDAWGLYSRESMCQLPSSAKGVRGCPKKPSLGFDIGWRWSGVIQALSQYQRHGWECHGESAGLSVRTVLLMDPCKARYRHKANFGGQSLTARRKVRQRDPWVSTPGLAPCSQKRASSR